ncbi:MAG: T9SS type A sorting domain-containing protein [Bacteroidota bacterium]
MVKSLHFVILIFLVGFLDKTKAQPFSFEKSYTHDVMSYDGVAGILNNNDSSYMLIAGNAAIGAMGDAESVVIQTDSSGNILHELVMGKPVYHDICKQVMRQGNDIYLAGYTRSTDTSASPLFTSFIVKTDNALNVVWQRNYIFPGNDLFFKAANTCASGNFLFSGNNYDFATGNWHTFIMKTSQNGNVTLCKMSDSFLSMEPGFITELNNHDILLTGSVTLGFEQVLPTVARFDSLGNMIWAKVFHYDPGSVQQSKILFAKELPSGSILLAGHTDYAGAANHGLMDYQVFKIDSAGTVQMMRTYGGGLIDWLYGADYDAINNELLLMGTTQSYTTNNSFYGFFMRVDTTGTIIDAVVQGDTTISGSQLILYNASILTSGNYILSGADMSGTTGFYSAKRNNGIFGPVSCHSIPVITSPLSAIYPEFINSVTPFPFDVNIQVNNVPFDYYTGVSDSLLCYQDVTSIEPVNNNEQISIYPNPAKEQFSIQSEREISLNIAVFNMLGEEIYSNVKLEITSRKSAEIDCRNFCSGIYIVEVNESRFKLVIKK